MRCSICQTNVEQDQLKHLSLYVNGSEGVEVCPSCDLTIRDYIIGLQRVATRSRLSFAKAIKG